MSKIKEPIAIDTVGIIIDSIKDSIEQYADAKASHIGAAKNIMSDIDIKLESLISEVRRSNVRPDAEIDSEFYHDNILYKIRLVMDSDITNIKKSHFMGSLLSNMTDILLKMIQE